MPPFTPYISKDFPIKGSFLRLDDKEKAWEEIDGRMRTAIRKAQQSSAEIKKATGTKEEMDAFRALCLNPWDMPETLTDRYHMYCAYLNGKMIAGILIVEINNKLFMLCHVSNDIAKKENIPSLLIWHVVEEFTGKQFRYLDIGASYRATLQSFFTGWRTQEYPMLMRPPALHPTLMLTPFDTQSFGTAAVPDAEKIVRGELEKKFDGKPYTFFPRAMYGIYTIVKFLKNEGKIPDGKEVWITTTSESPYVSSCVTSAIEQVCPWSRELSEKTAAIFLIHDFGFLHPKLKEMRKLADERGIPLIEDCAYGWGTEGAGKTGDYVIYSLTKEFPVQFGGFVVGKHFTHEELWNEYQTSDANKEAFTLKQLSPWVGKDAENRAKRQENWRYYEKIFGADRCFFPLAEGTDPGAFLLKMKDEKTMNETVEFVCRFDIECGNFWKNSAIMLPVHQRLEPMHLDYIAGAVMATEREWCGVPRD